jgi:ribosomal-protein-alanine N-acetyltransferase
MDEKIYAISPEKSNLSGRYKGVYKVGPFSYDAGHMLEMTNEIIICPMTAEDLDQVLAIEQASFPSPWLRQHFVDELNSAHAFPLSAFEPGGRLVGFICPMLLLDEGHILDVAVDPACRGKGVGRLLVQRVLDDCRIGGASFVSLEVRVSNDAAIALYQGMGFTEVGRRKRYYRDGEDALMMEYLYPAE